MSTTHKPNDRVMVVSGLYDGYPGTVVKVERGLGLVPVQLDGRHGTVNFWPDELITIGTHAPTEQDAEDDWDDGSFYDIVRCTAPYAPRWCESGNPLPRRRTGSSQAGLQALKFGVAPPQSGLMSMRGGAS